MSGWRDPAWVHLCGTIWWLLSLLHYASTLMMVGHSDWMIDSLFWGKAHVSWSKAVSKQNMIGIYIVSLALIQLTDNKQNLVCNYWLLKWQPAVMSKNWGITAGCDSKNLLFQTTFCSSKLVVISITDCCIHYFVYDQSVGSKSAVWYRYLLCFVHWLHRS